VLENCQDGELINKIMKECQKQQRMVNLFYNIDQTKRDIPEYEAGVCEDLDVILPM
jgi:hypothetical protein